MNYQETLDLLFSQLPMYQRSGAAAYKNDLSVTLAIDAYLDHPHRHYKNIHVAGTNGKGSVSHMIASILQAAGYTTALYTSPHYTDFRERIAINGAMISENDVIRFTEQTYPHLKHLAPSFFELTFGMAMEYFRQQNVDVAIWETGMGGRLDSTNVVSPEVAVVTNISYDHTRFLGDTLTEIAQEKAGIIKKLVPVVIGERQSETENVFIAKAIAQGAPLSFASDEIVFSDCDISMTGISAVWKEIQIDLPLAASYQLQNLKTCLQTIVSLRAKGWQIADCDIRDGLQNIYHYTGFRGRFQILSRHPLIIADSGHNIAGVEAVIKQMGQINAPQKHLVLGMVNDKDIRSVLSLMPVDGIYYFAKANIPRGLDAEQLMASAAELGLKGKAYTSVQQAFQKAKQNAAPDDLIFIGGSTFTVAEVL
ncbi:MAG: bifunctional folylpolyglutamate synthase/dihydrofolate synthase [Bacteroidota bacterium]